MTNIQEIRQRAEKFGLYESKFEHDACDSVLWLVLKEYQATKLSNRH